MNTIQATRRALALVKAGKMTAYAAAKAEGIALSTIYRALKREREAAASVAAQRRSGG